MRCPCGVCAEVHAISADAAGPLDDDVHQGRPEATAAALRQGHDVRQTCGPAARALGVGNPGLQGADRTGHDSPLDVDDRERRRLPGADSPTEPGPRVIDPPVEQWGFLVEQRRPQWQQLLDVLASGIAGRRRACGQGSACRAPAKRVIPLCRRQLTRSSQSPPEHSQSPPLKWQSVSRGLELVSRSQTRSPLTAAQKKGWPISLSGCHSPAWPDTFQRCRKNRCPEERP